MSLQPPVHVEPGLGQLVSELARESAVLVREEMNLARAELVQSLAEAERDATRVAIGSGLVMAGALVLLGAIVLFLAWLGLVLWLSALIVAVVAMAIGGGVAQVGLRGLKHVHLMPRQTIETFKEDAAWLHNKIR